MNIYTIRKFCSQRLKYRAITIDDAENMVRWRSREDIYLVSGDKRPITIEEHIKWFDKYQNNPNEIRFVITEKNSLRDIGMVGGKYTEEVFLLSYYIGEDEFRKMGFAGEAIRALIKHIHNNFGISNFQADIQENNLPSISTVLKIGFTLCERQGEMLKYCFIFNDEV